jgi:hypothetical protein
VHKINYDENMYGRAKHPQLQDLIWTLHNNKAIIIKHEILNTSDIKYYYNTNPLPR